MKGKWIAYPDDFEFFLAEKVQSRRFQRDLRLSSVWRIDSPYHFVRFQRSFELSKACTLEIRAEGDLTVYYDNCGKRTYCYDFDGKLYLSAGRYALFCAVYNKEGLPCLCIDGDGFCSDENFLVTNTGHYTGDLVRSVAVVDCGDLTPNTYCLPRREISPKAEFACDGGKVYDFSHTVMAYVILSELDGKQVKCYFGETLAECMSDADCEQIDFWSGVESHETPIAKAFRYLRIVTDSPYKMKISEEYSHESPTLSYCGCKRMEDIISVANRTFSLCSREFYLDGAKRDRWIWGGDAYQAFKSEYFYGYNTEKIRRTLVALLGKPPVITYVNRIMDYTMYVLMSLREYYMQTGDKDFLKRIYPIAKQHVDFALGRVNADGMLIGRAEDWIFVDWGNIDKEGALCFEQMLFYFALSSMSEICDAIGECGNHYAEIASALKEKIMKIFWNEKRGVFVHSYANGEQSDCVTAYANVFAVLYDFVSGEKARRIGNALLNDGSIPTLITPYMQEFKLGCLFKLGEWKAAADEIYEYWGGMLDGGATTFWETYEKGEHVETATAMYDRPFGRSQCHIWGAGVLYLVPRFWFGIRNDIDFGEHFEVKPIAELIQNLSITVPLKKGTLKVSCNNGKISVFSDALSGDLIVNGKKYAVPAGVSITV